MNVKKVLDENAATVIGAPTENDLRLAKLVHHARFVDFIETCWDRAQTDPAGKRFQDEDYDDVCYGAWCYNKHSEPQQDTWAAEIIAYSGDGGPIFQDTADTLKSDLGVVRKSVSLILENPTSNVYAQVTNPGHHAGPCQLSGYCFLNNVSVAAKMLIEAGKSVGIVDVDFHGGNGTYDIIRENRLPGAQFVSLHQGYNFPYVEMKKNGRNFERPTFAEYAPVLQQILDSWNGLDVILVSMGFDTFKDDPIADPDGFHFDVPDYREIGVMLSKAQPQILLVQEGGYAIDMIPILLTNLLQGLAEN